jgi:hypothetical protein
MLPNYYSLVERSSSLFQTVDEEMFFLTSTLVHSADHLLHHSSCDHHSFSRFKLGVNVIKLFTAVTYGRNLRIFIIGYSYCPWQAFQAYTNKHSSLLQTIVNVKLKSFITLGQCYKTFYGRNLGFS